MFQFFRTYNAHIAAVVLVFLIGGTLVYARHMQDSVEMRTAAK